MGIYHCRVAIINSILKNYYHRFISTTSFKKSTILSICTENYRTFVLNLFMNHPNSQQARFDARLTKTQKDFFEMAATLGGYKSLSEFIVHATQQAANNIVQQHNSILANEKDKEIFFEALINPPLPNNALKEAGLLYKSLVTKK